MQARVARLYLDQPEPRYLDLAAAPLGDLSVIYMARERRATLTVNPPSPRRLLPDLQGVEVDGLSGTRLRLVGHELAGGRRREVVWICELTPR